jgi:hypothetical protein
MNLFIRFVSSMLTDFERIFFAREYKALAGRNQRTLAALAGILFLTFLALGFAVGSLGNLERKMDNPYTNWVDLAVGESYISRKASEIHAEYSEPAIAEKFGLKNTNGFNKYFVEFHQRGFSPFRHRIDTLTKTFMGRTVEAEESLLAEILNPQKGNVIWTAPGARPENFDGCDIIVTEYLLHQLGYESLDSLRHLSISDGDQLIYLRIAAVVSELPSLCRFITSPKLYNILSGQTDGPTSCYRLITANREGSNRFALITDYAADLSALDAVARQFFQQQSPTFVPDSVFTLGQEIYRALTLAFLPVEAPEVDTIEAFVQWAGAQVPLAVYAPIECSSHACSSIDFGAYHNLAFHFKRLDAVRAFRTDMQEKFNIEIDLSQIEAKENFALVSRLTFAISLVLMAFSVLNIVFFVNNLLRTHLFEVRSNLGTFQAFGLGHRFLVGIYLKIIFAFLTLSIAIAFALGMVVDRLEQWGLGSESKFNIFNNWILLAIIGLYLVSWLISARTIRRILGDTPGNLIYER